MLFSDASWPWAQELFAHDVLSKKARKNEEKKKYKAIY
jgi:hypothetical protein